jgi:multidrug efflux system membrane fusion protein
MREVKIARQLGDEIVVEGELKAGEQVVTEGQLRLENGTKVEIQKKDAPAPEASLPDAAVRISQ